MHCKVRLQIIKVSNAAILAFAAITLIVKMFEVDVRTFITRVARPSSAPQTSSVGAVGFVSGELWFMIVSKEILE